jgi:prepilin signal peptidase PulO-like enzyme (type II secretory pathway)
MFATKKDRKTEIPFGPWLALAAVVYMFKLLELII